MSNAKSDSINNEVNMEFLNFDIFAKDGYKSLANSIRHSNSLPANSDWNFYKLNESFCNIVATESSQVLSLMNSILRRYDIEDTINTKKGVKDKIEFLIEANDTILERVSDNLDDINGVKKKNIDPVEFQTVTAQLPISESWNRINKVTFSVSTSVNLPRQTASSAQSIHLLTGKNIVRPQQFFKDKIDNSNNYPWQPRITEKPNSIRPLALYIEETEFGEVFCHPYQTELDQFEPPPDLLRSTPLTIPKPISETPLHIIETHEKLHDLVEELRKHTCIGIDLEHHSYRTFMGITCLMQISTTEADYIVDTLKLRDQLHVLNEIFTRRSIVKIFHGADADVLWLQRDLSLYIVNMFDTHQAAKQLGYSGLSLAYLLQRFCKFIPNKQFQLADWRIRPLPQELINYAREDTHYLIYLYSVLKQELLKQGNGKDNILRSVIQRSTEICKKKYIKPILTNDSHLDFYRKCKRLFDNRQMYALKELYQWRDKIAREEDESTGYVLPNHMMLQISEMLPREMQGILACCNPIPPLVRSHLLELHQIVLKAREQSAEKPIMKEDNRSEGSTQQFSRINVDNPIYCPHDLTKHSEFRDDLRVLISNSSSNISDWLEKFSNIALEKKLSRFSVFNATQTLDDENTSAEKRDTPRFLGPYERYKLVKPYIQSEEKKMQNLPENVDKSEKPDDPSTSDRIASLHKHFIKVSKIYPQQKNQLEQTDPSEQQPEPSKMDHISLNMLPQSSRHYSIPKNSNKKRKFEENCQPLKYMRGAKKKKNNNYTSESLQSNNESCSNAIDTSTPILNNPLVKRNRPNKRKRKNKYIQKPQQQQQRQQQQQQTQQQQKQQQIPASQNNIPPLFKEGNSGKKRPKNNGSDLNEGNANNFAPFDYSSVDYSLFQGSTSNSSQNKKFKSKFKGKNKRKFSGKWNNKTSTFNNSKNMKI